MYDNRRDYLIDEKLAQKEIDFNDNEKVIYTPENWDDDEKEGYTGQDFLELCDGDLELAQRIYDACEWQHPETILDEMSRDDEE